MKRIATFKDYVGELTVTYKRTELPQTKIRSSRDAADFIRPYFDEIMDDHEEVKVIHLSRSNGVVNIDHASTGAESSCIVPVQSIVRKVALIKTSAVILVHNHPSGKLTPSEQDKKITKKLKDALDLLDVKLLDSLIMTRESYTSMADECLI